MMMMDVLSTGTRLRRSVVVTTGIVLLASICACLELVTFDKSCRSEDILSPLPASLRGWQVNSSLADPSTATHVYIPSTETTLFWSQLNDTFGAIFSASPRKQEPLPVFSLKADIAPNFVRNDNGVICFNGGNTTEPFIACCDDSLELSYISGVHHAIDPIFMNGKLWFRGKGPSDLKSNDEHDRNSLHYVYSYDLQTKKQRTEAILKCSEKQSSEYQMSDWCNEPARHGMHTIKGQLAASTTLEDRCTTISASIFLFVALSCTIGIIVKRVDLLPEAWLTLSALVASSCYATIMVLSGHLSHGDGRILGAVYLLVGFLLALLGRFDQFRCPWMAIWSVALIRVGTVLYTAFIVSLDRRDPWWDEIFYIFTTPMLILFGTTRLRVCAWAAATSILMMVSRWRLEFPSFSGGYVLEDIGVLLVCISGPLMILIGIFQMRRWFVRIGVLVYSIVVWSNLDGVPQEEFFVAILFFFGFGIIPLAGVAYCTNDSTSSLLAMAGLSIQFLMLAYAVIDRFVSSLEEVSVTMGHGLVIIFAFVSMVATFVTFSEIVKVLDRPREIPTVLMAALRRWEPRRMRQIQERIDEGQEEDPTNEDDVGLLAESPGD